MSQYEILFHPAWDSCYSKLDNSMKKRVMKKISQLSREAPARHLAQGLEFFVSEIGQYRLCYKTNEKNKTRIIYFVGDHKEYEKWLGL